MRDFLRELTTIATVFVALLVIGNVAHAQQMSDKNKLDQLERKAQYELDRAASFAKRGVKGYTPSSKSLQISLPTTRKACSEQMRQLTRLRKQASPAARAWINYEFDEILKHSRRLKT